MNVFLPVARRLACGAVTVTAVAGAFALTAGAALADAGGASGWHLGYYTPSAKGTLSNSQAASSPGSVAAFGFTNQPNAALLYNDQQGSGLVGDDADKGISAGLTVSGLTPGTTFTYGGEGTPLNPCVAPASVRFYFETSNAGGFNPGDYWWSNPVSSPLVTNGSSSIDTTFDPSNWSDYYGQNGASDPSDFDNAVSDVTKIGLSFGGGCFFENGVGTTDGSGTFTLNSFTVG